MSPADPTPGLDLAPTGEGAGRVAAPPSLACPVPNAAALGFIEEVHGPVIDIRCTRLPPLHRALYVLMGEERYPFEVYRHLDEHRVRAIALHRTGGLRRRMPVFDAGGPLAVPVTPATRTFSTRSAPTWHPTTTAAASC